MSSYGFDPEAEKNPSAQSTPAPQQAQPQQPLPPQPEQSAGFQPAPPQGGNQNQQYPGPYYNQQGYQSQPNQQAYASESSMTAIPGYAPEASDARTIAMLGALSPMLSLIATIIMFLVYKDKPGYQRAHTALARMLNFSITLTFWGLGIGAVNILGALLVGVSQGSGAGAGIGIILMAISGLGLLAMGIMSLVCTIISAVKFNSGANYYFPLKPVKFVPESPIPFADMTRLNAPGAGQAQPTQQA
ncbi:MAG: DUF4870 domain-containing protein [Rothia sp. (in: high G+C Gram-positive bacteria)]|uniref:DUF4870 domain-containing protein n=1 Tax=Rothia sp. (in: high G+C Gram-positive bacteria) TaxID=1885016 RepID=UPI0026DF072B|nr:DUF4870 domain-containing protein [Rothia sp. (in: high G+C Gram-positive bacteria)]MDO5750494.1 DUF4870 domain-containing protein [Rothia sp. (in: high G+C Gram-positive bacteria)]